MSGDELDRISVASPCTESWEDMQGDNRVRFCGKCEQDVYRLTDLPRVEANALLERARGGEEICVRYARRADGTIVTNDCPSTIQRGRGGLPFSSVVRTLAAGLAATVGAGLTTGCFEEEPQPIAPQSSRPQTQPQVGQPPAQPQQTLVPDEHLRMEMGEVALPAPDREEELRQKRLRQQELREELAAQEKEQEPRAVPRRRDLREVQGGMCPPPEDLRVRPKPQPDEREPKLLPIAKEESE